MPKQIGHGKALRLADQDNPEGRTLRKDPTVEPNISALQDGSAPGIEARLADYVSDVLAMPHAGQLEDLSIFEAAVELGRYLERQALGIAPRPQPSRRRLFLVALGGDPR